LEIRSVRRAPPAVGSRPVFAAATAVRVASVPSRFQAEEGGEVKLKVWRVIGKKIVATGEAELLSTSFGENAEAAAKWWFKHINGKEGIGEWSRTDLTFAEEGDSVH
jgi:hypothetical protein